MKIIGFTMPLIFGFFGLMAQTQSAEQHGWSISKYYGSAGVVFGYPGTFGKLTTGINFNNQWGLAFEGMQTYYKSKNLPPGYRTGFCLFGDCTPKDRVQIYTLQVNREFNLPWKYLSTVVGAGPSQVVYDQRFFKTSSSGSFGSFFEGSNHDDFLKLKRVPGLSLYAKLVVQPYKHFALGLGWFSNFNSAKTVGGVEVSVIAGKLN